MVIYTYIMLAKRYRYPLGRQDFDTSNATKRHLPELLIFYKPNQSSLRLTTIISKKIDNSDVVRNKLKRQMYQIFNQPNFLKIPFDIMIIAKPKIKELTFSDLKQKVINNLPKPK